MSGTGERRGRSDDRRCMPLPKIEWADVEEELRRQGEDPNKIFTQATASFEAWSSMSLDERKAQYEYPSLDDKAARRLAGPCWCYWQCCHYDQCRCCAISRGES